MPTCFGTAGAEPGSWAVETAGHNASAARKATRFVATRSRSRCPDTLCRALMQFIGSLGLSTRLAFLRGRRCRRSHSPNLDDRFLVLCAVVMNLARVVNDITSGGSRHGIVGIELFAGSHPPRSGYHNEKSVIRMKVRPAHTSRQPFEAHHIGS